LSCLNEPGLTAINVNIVSEHVHGLESLIDHPNRLLMYSQTCLQRSATGNYKSGRYWQMAFVRSVRNYLSNFHGKNSDWSLWTGNHYSQVSLCTGLTVYW